MSVETSTTVRSVRRALDLLDVLIESAEGLPLNVLAKATDLNDSTAYRLLGTLLEAGYVRLDPETKKYFLGPHLYKAHKRSLDHLDLRSVSMRHLQELAAKTNELVNIAILVDFSAVYIAQANAVKRNVQMFTQIGAKAPLYCTGVGKVMMAHMTDAQIDQYCETTHLESHTIHTITNKIQLKAELEKIRQQGYAIDNEERELGVRCFAAPIYSTDYKFVASVSLSGPPSRLALDKEPQFSQEIIQTAARISQDLGCENPIESTKPGVDDAKKNDV